MATMEKDTIRRELHIRPGVVIYRNNEIDFIIEVFQRRRDAVDCRWTLSGRVLKPRDLKSLSIPILGTLYLTEPGYEYDGEPIQFVVFNRADIELIFSPNDPKNEDGPRSLYRFEISNTGKPPIRVEAKVPCESFNWQNSIDGIDTHLRRGKVPVEEQKQLRQRRNQLFHQLKLDVIDRLHTFVSQPEVVST